MARQLVTLASRGFMNMHFSMNHKLRWKSSGSVVASHATNQGCLVVLACFTTTTINASCLGVPPSECHKYTAKPSVLLWQTRILERVVPHFQATDVNAPSFFVDDNPEANINRQRDSTRRVLAIHTACTRWCVLVRLLQTAILASPFFLNLSSISSLLSLCSIPKKKSYVLLYLTMYKFSLLQGKPLSKRHIIVVAGLSASDLLGFVTNPQMFALAVFTLHQVLGVILLPVSFSDKPSLAIYCFHWSANSAGLLKPHSLREVSETPVTPCSPISTLSFLVSSLRRLSCLPSWLRSYGVEFQLHHIKIFLP